MNESESRASGRGAFAELKEAVGNLFESVVGLAPDLGFGRDFPRHEMRVEDKGYVVQVELPGMRREAIEVSVSGRTLTISGKRPKFEAPADGRMIRSERPYGKFDLSVRLPDEVDTLGVVAKMRDGILDVQLPKPSAGGRSIEVETAEAEPNGPSSESSAVEEPRAESPESQPKHEESVTMPWEESKPEHGDDTGDRHE
ncbi:MAG: Hsp20/alpha crystallin family protein [Gemmatimonadales bacterium]